jgi:hypothetical protein
MVAGLALARPAGADAGVRDVQGWQEVRATPEGRIFHKPMQGSAIPQVLITARFAAPAAAVYGVVTDYAHLAEFIPGVAESRIIRAAGDAQWVFHRLHFGGPVADRVYVMRSVATAEGVDRDDYRVEWALAPEPVPAGEQGSTPRQFSGFWELNSADGGNATEARYAVHSDPGGWIPPWLVTRMTDRYVRDVVRAVRMRLERVDPNTGRSR